jgi:hypothetical protein
MKIAPRISKMTMIRISAPKTFSSLGQLRFDLSNVRPPVPSLPSDLCQHPFGANFLEITGAAKAAPVILVTESQTGSLV